MPHAPLLQMDKAVPFGEAICCRLRLVTDWNWIDLVRASYRHEPHYLAWETVRKGRNPFFENGTGFEGYFVGLCPTPEDALDRILETSQQMLTSITRLHRFEPRFRSTLIKTLVGEMGDLPAISEWAAQFGATLARLRCNLIRNPQSDAFHTEISRLVSRSPSMSYIKNAHSIRQCYQISSGHDPNAVRIVVSMSDLKASEQDAWLIAASVGKFGHPLVREFVRLSAN